jgi:hypothetical protein
MRSMAEQSPDSPLFGVSFLLTALFRRPSPDQRRHGRLWPAPIYLERTNYG